MVIKGCFFHYTQCIWRKTYYKENDGITKLVRRAAVLPLVPQNEIEDVWFNALQDIGDPDNVLDTTTFTDYVTERWVETHIFLWNHYLTRGTPHHKPSTQAVTEITISQYAAGEARPSKRPIYRRIDSILQQLKDTYRQELVTVTV